MILDLSYECTQSSCSFPSARAWWVFVAMQWEGVLLRFVFQL